MFSRDQVVEFISAHGNKNETHSKMGNDASKFQFSTLIELPKDRQGGRLEFELYITSKAGFF